MAAASKKCKQVWMAAWGGGDWQPTDATTGLDAMRNLAATLKATVRMDDMENFVNELGEKMARAYTFIGTTRHSIHARLVNLL